MAVASVGRNQSAPMIFDVTRSVRPSALDGGHHLRRSPADAHRTNPRIVESGMFEDATKCVTSSSSSPSSSSSSSSSSSTLSSYNLPPLLTASSTTNDIQGQERLLTVEDSRTGSEAPPTTPTSCYSQSGIIHFEKQESEDKVTEIDAEWIIPWSDIQVGQVISRRGSCTINRYVYFRR